MTYAHRNDIYDADTHMMEPPTWLAEFADAKLRPHLAPFGQGVRQQKKKQSRHWPGSNAAKTAPKSTQRSSSRSCP